MRSVETWLGSRHIGRGDLYPPVARHNWHQGYGQPAPIRPSDPRDLPSPHVGLYPQAERFYPQRHPIRRLAPGAGERIMGVYRDLPVHPEQRRMGRITTPTIEHSFYGRRASAAAAGEWWAPPHLRELQGSCRPWSSPLGDCHSDETWSRERYPPTEPEDDAARGREP